MSKKIIILCIALLCGLYQWSFSSTLYAYEAHNAIKMEGDHEAQESHHHKEKSQDCIISSYCNCCDIGCTILCNEIKSSKVSLNSETKKLFTIISDYQSFRHGYNIITHTIPSPIITDIPIPSPIPIEELMCRIGAIVRII